MKPANCIRGLILLAALGTATAASAQATRTWVSGVGDDANPCSRTAPCKTFAGAISKTAAAGEINVLDPGAYGAVTITKAITIRSDGLPAGVLVSGTNAIIVNIITAPATSDVILSGLDIEGLGSGLTGVKILQAGDVFLEKSTINGFTAAGVSVETPNVTRVFLRDVAVRNSTVGVNVAATSTNQNLVIADQTRLLSNSIGARVANSKSRIDFTNSMIGPSQTADLSILNNGVIGSYRNNIIRTGSPSTTLSLK